MFQKNKLSSSVEPTRGSSILGRVTSVAVATLFSVTAMAQQVGTIEGQVSLDQGMDAPGVTVRATSNVMPRARTATTGPGGEFRLPMLIPGTYTITFTAEDGTSRTVRTEVLLDQVTKVDVHLAPQVTEGLEEIVVTGEMITAGRNSSLSDAFGADVIQGLPIGQDYRDLMKLAPGVQYTQNAIRGPSAGGSGQDNVYKFDGVNVTLPMFGTLSAEPSSQDVEQFSVERGGARAVGFNRAGGVTVNSISKSGTNEFKGSVEYRLQPAGLRETPKEGVKSDVSESWMSANVGGPLIEDQLFFYGSYYGPREDGENKVTAYGPTKDYSSERDEYYGKLTYAPIDNLLLNAAYRTSDKTVKGRSIGEFEADSVSVGDTSSQDILSLDGSWIIGDNTTLSFQYSDYKLETAGVPDNKLGVRPEFGGSLDIANLDQMGYFSVPNPIEGRDAYNAFIQDYVDRYGYPDSGGNPAGGGGVGGYYQSSIQNFYNKSFEVALDHSFDIGSTSHELHVGYQWSEGREELQRVSNGWGLISVVEGAVDEDAPDNAWFLARTEQMSFVTDDGSRVPPINSYTESQNFEINDSISWKDFIFDLGFLISQDTLYGQGLREVSGNLSGYEAAPGKKYEMYKVDWKDMIQPRLGVSWAYNGVDTVFASFAQYNPAANSLARAASWDRSTQAMLNVYFDEDGNFISSSPRAGSSGKLFVDNLTPRRTDELTVGTTKEFDNGISLRSHVRYRESSHFWEDIWNGARTYGCYGENEEFCVPDRIAEKGLYIDDLDAKLAEIGSGSTFVVAEIDDGYTKYLEFSVEASWMGERTYLNASYTRSRYRGNVDQDNTTAINDQNIFIGSSNLMDSRGMMVWDNKDGTLRGDRPHLLKVFGQYRLNWDANVGAYFVYQSGEPWEAWDGSIYGYASDTIRYAEPAGSRRGPSHWQMDLNYTQHFTLFEDYRLRFRADVFNLFDRQTGYNFQPSVHAADFGEARNYYNPRRLQLSVGMDF